MFPATTPSTSPSTSLPPSSSLAVVFDQVSAHDDVMIAYGLIIFLLAVAVATFITVRFA